MFSTSPFAELIPIQEIAFARKRMADEGRQEREPYTKAKVKKILKSWHIWMLSLLYA